MRVKVRRSRRFLITELETKILQLAADGYDNDRIGSKLFMSKHTVKAHFRTIFSKLGAVNRTNAVYIATKLRLIK